MPLIKNALTMPKQVGSVTPQHHLVGCIWLHLLSISSLYAHVLVVICTLPEFLDIAKLRYSTILSDITQY